MRKNNFNRRKNMREIEEKDFSKEVEKGVTLVDFFATWCMPCRMMGQILEDVAGEMVIKSILLKSMLIKTKTLQKSMVLCLSQPSVSSKTARNKRNILVFGSLRTV